ALHDLGDAVDGDDARLAQARRVLDAGHQNSSPASRAASAAAAIRPWYRKPPRSNTTFETPAAWARSATSLPTLAAASVLPVAPVRRSASTVDAAANVRPSASSITCSTRCLFERNTARRGRSAVPWIFLRTR